HVRQPSHARGSVWRMMRALVVMPVLLVHEQADHLLLRRSPGHASRGGRDVSRIAYLSAYMPTLCRDEEGPCSAFPLTRGLIWCPRQDSNLRPSAPEADALSTELRGPPRAV